ncbi:unnamed protein product [Bemisia tabaci]|uniref:C2H2-type domain-containing protein n=1 Tax=Bemisia tabaci TaxID=7038 RepID=A0A9P0A8S7_BEMTA|nr:unnamed protein product [Bemisia tabaci]
MMARLLQALKANTRSSTEGCCRCRTAVHGRVVGGRAGPQTSPSSACHAAKGADALTPIDQLRPEGHQLMEREPLFDSVILDLQCSSATSSEESSSGGCSSPACFSPEGSLSPGLMKDAGTQTEIELLELFLNAFPYFCRLCPRRFPTQINLISHQEADHTEENTATQPVAHSVCTPNNQEDTRKKIMFLP